MNNPISLTPGFSPVDKGQDDNNRFNGFPCARNPLKQFSSP